MIDAPQALIVDDNPLNSRLACLFLQRRGWESTVADRGQRALDLLATQAFDLVLLDLRMPQMSGEEVCRRIRTDLRMKDLPVVAYTAHGMQDDRARILSLGFDALLIKPISFSSMSELCDRLGQGRAALRLHNAP